MMVILAIESMVGVISLAGVVLWRWDGLFDQVLGINEHVGALFVSKRAAYFQSWRS